MPFDALQQQAASTSASVHDPIELRLGADVVHTGGMSGNEFRTVAPVFPVADVMRAMEHYRELGFEVTSHDRGTDYAFANRDEVWLHLSRVDGLDPSTTTSAAYLYVADADALAAEWHATGAEGRFVDPVDTDYGLREGAHVDPDGNLLRYGSPLAD